jgi:hypothetical protein
VSILVVLVDYAMLVFHILSTEFAYMCTCFTRVLLSQCGWFLISMST